MNIPEIEARYQELCNAPSDINEHLPILKEYADRCDHVTEMGVRGCVSLFAFLASNAKKVVAIDILNVWTPEVEKLTFICADDLEIEIEETDMLFIDSKHTGDHLKQELSLHANKVKKFIGMHDTGIFYEHGDDGTEGLGYAIEPFLKNNNNWVIDYSTKVNNGLMILKRV